MTATATAWSARPTEAGWARPDGSGDRRGRSAANPAKQAPTARRAKRPKSWNVLAEEIVPFRDVRGRGGEAWLERELLVLRYLADSGYPVRHVGAPIPTGAPIPIGAPGGARRAAAERSGGAAVAVRPRRQGRGRTRSIGRSWPRPRGILSRLLPGSATLLVIVGIWLGAGMLSSINSPAMAVLPGSVKVPGGYEYVVRPGDTLWSIASRLEPGGDPRALVAELGNETHGTTLMPGTVLHLP